MSLKGLIPLKDQKTEDPGDTMGWAPNILSIWAETMPESLGVRLGASTLAKEGPEPINTKAGRGQLVRTTGVRVT